MRVLVTWGSKRGGTEGIARVLGEALEREGFSVELLPAREAVRSRGFDAVVVGGALYANSWHPAARRFVRRREQELQKVPSWFFSSGPLDDSAQQRELPPVTQVQLLMERVGAQGHKTFGGRLAPDARGFPASAMAKKHAGDWRSPELVRAWASELARALPTARPRPAVSPPGSSWARVVAHGALGWAACATTMWLLLRTLSLGAALALHAAAAPALFVLVARHYFQARGAREPLAVAAAFTGIVALLDLVVVAGLTQRSLALFASPTATWLPFALIFAATWATGALLSMMPGSRPRSPSEAHS